MYIPEYVANLILQHRAAQKLQKSILGRDYHDYGLVFSRLNGDPYEVKYISNMFKSFIQHNSLREVDLYSLRHTGATIKMEATHDIKALQADMGHASPEMATKVYLDVTERGRRRNAAATASAVFSKLAKDKAD